MIFRTGVALHAAVVMAYVTLTLWQTWPLATAPGAWAPHDLGDPLLSTWALWWNATHVPFTHVVVERRRLLSGAGALALSDHRVGIGLITTPLILGGVTPLAAHNVAFLAELRAVCRERICAGLLADAERARRAFIAGLVYGFHPFRSEHLPHLELLSVVLAAAGAAGPPSVGRHLQAALARAARGIPGARGVHHWLLLLLSRRPDRALAAVVRALGPAARRYVELGVGAGAAVRAAGTRAAGVSIDTSAIRSGPIDHGDRRSQRRHPGLGDGRPSRSAFWNAPAAWRTPEGAVFPGVTASLLVAIASASPGVRGSEPSRAVAPAHGARSASASWHSVSR